MPARLAVVTATIDYPRAERWIRSWVDKAAARLDVYIVGQGQTRRDWEILGRGSQGTLYGYHSREMLGVVPAFALGVRRALEDGGRIIACLHDDLEIEQIGWDEEVIRLFKACPRAGLCGFGGAKGLGEDDIYQTPYNPMQLVRKSFGSNMRHAEAHGARWEAAQPVACLDGFAQIGLRNFWLGLQREAPGAGSEIPGNHLDGPKNLFDRMAAWGVTHHFYDGMLGAFAKRLGYQVWYIPVKVHHHGGLTAVSDARYHAWADTQRPEGYEGTGDQHFWEAAHRIGYEQFRDVLPIRA